jgi:hypothetical protein
MGIAYNTSQVTDGLIFAIDAANPRSYSGSGITVNGLISGLGGTLVGAGFGSTNGGYFTFRNNTDKLNIGNPSVLQGLQLNFTLSCWFNQIANNQYSTLYADYSLDNSHKLVSLLRVDGGTLRYYTSNSSGGIQAVNPASITNGLWYFVSVTVSGTLSSPTTSIFLNGTTFNNSLSALSSTPDTTATHSIGGNVYANEGFNGNISQLSIYNRPLSAQEIRQNFNATRKRYGV